MAREIRSTAAPFEPGRAYQSGESFTVTYTVRAPIDFPQHRVEVTEVGPDGSVTLKVDGGRHYVLYSGDTLTLPTYVLERS